MMRNLARRSNDPYVSDPPQDLRFAPVPAPHARLATATQGFGDSRDAPGYVAVLVGADPPYDTGYDSDPLTIDERDRGVDILDAIVDEHFEETS